jgi:Acetyltransferase (GNAT) family
MQVTTYSDPGAFLVRAELFVDSDPFSSSVIATVTTRIAAGALPNNGNLWLSVEADDARVIGLAMHTPPHNMFLSRMPEDAVDALAKEVDRIGRDLPGVNGATASTRTFVRAWAQMTDRSSRLVTESRMYRLTELRWPEAVEGQAHRAGPNELGLVAEWLAAFHDEAQPDSPVDDWTAGAKRRIDAGEIHLWRAEDIPVAVAGVSRAVAGVARVGPVYTPSRCRGNGYGSSVTASATSAALSSGARHVVLYTDLANPTRTRFTRRLAMNPTTMPRRERSSS